jgi:Ca2+-binding EF-hand superfamily protein
MQKEFNTFDKDKDHKISQQEDHGLWSRDKIYDANGNNGLDINEFIRSREDMREGGRRGPDFRTADANHDKKITADELTAKFGSEVNFSAWDKDNSGYLDEKEYRKMASRYQQFDKLDVNGDKTLSASELARQRYAGGSVTRQNLASGTAETTEAWRLAILDKDSSQNVSFNEWGTVANTYFMDLAIDASGNITHAPNGNPNTSYWSDVTFNGVTYTGFSRLDTNNDQMVSQQEFGKVYDTASTLFGPGGAFSANPEWAHGWLGYVNQIYLAMQSARPR